MVEQKITGEQAVEKSKDTDKLPNVAKMSLQIYETLYPYTKRERSRILRAVAHMLGLEDDEV